MTIFGAICLLCVFGSEKAVVSPLLTERLTLGFFLMTVLMAIDEFKGVFV